MHEVDPLVTLAHARSVVYCSRGMRAFAAQHGLNWMEFVRDGIPASVLEATGDAMAIKAAAVARHAATIAAGNRSDE